MQITGMLIFLAVWLFILWVGSITLEATGMERSKARFQALSALTGTGFTTREAEYIVNHPKRRRIVSWMIFLGNVGIVAFILVMILYLRAGLRAPTPAHIIIMLISILVVGLIAWAGVISKLSNVIINLVRKERQTPAYIAEETLYQTGDFGVVRTSINEKALSAGLRIGDTGLKERNVIVLAIERDNKVLNLPDAEEELKSGDNLICYGKLTEISGLGNK